MAFKKNDKTIKRNERNQDKEAIEKLESEYEESITTTGANEEPIFAIEEIKTTEETKATIEDLEKTADELSDPGVKSQLNSIVAGNEIVADQEIDPPFGFVAMEKTIIPTQEKDNNMAAEIYEASKAIESRPPPGTDLAEEKILVGNKANAVVDEVNEELLETVNEAAETLLKCLPDEMAKDFRTACFKDFAMKDMGIYIMGLLNRLYKVGDYYNPDIEPEWDKRVVGYSSELYCNHCGKLIENPGNLNQLFCSNICSKNYKEKYSTGVIKPVEKDLPTEEEQDQKAWDGEEF